MILIRDASICSYFALCEVSKCFTESHRIRVFHLKVSGIRIVNTALNFLNISPPTAMQFSGTVEFIKVVYISVIIPKKLSVIFIDRSSNYDYCIVLFITKNHKVHRFNICTRNLIQIKYHEYIYQIPYMHVTKKNFFFQNFNKIQRVWYLWINTISHWFTRKLYHKNTESKITCIQ